MKTKLKKALMKIDDGKTGQVNSEVFW
jgi:hypothetical protein